MKPLPVAVSSSLNNNNYSNSNNSNNTTTTATTNNNNNNDTNNNNTTNNNEEEDIWTGGSPADLTKQVWPWWTPARFIYMKKYPDLFFPQASKQTNKQANTEGGSLYE